MTDPRLKKLTLGTTPHRTEWEISPEQDGTVEIAIAAGNHLGARTFVSYLDPDDCDRLAAELVAASARLRKRVAA